MKITKLELKEMIRETLREELANNKKFLAEDVAHTQDRYIVISGEFPTSYYVHCLTASEDEAADVCDDAMLDFKNFEFDLEAAKLFDLTQEEINRLEAMIGKKVTGADADFIADFFADGSRVDSLYNSFS